MFTVPEIPTNPEALLLANEFLAASNFTLANLATFRREQFTKFWFKGHNVLRTPEEINAILEQMDQASPGQAYKFFATGVALKNLIEAISGQAIEPEEWYPKYEYTDENYVIRMKVPIEEPVPEDDE